MRHRYHQGMNAKNTAQIQARIRDLMARGLTYWEAWRAANDPRPGAAGTVYLCNFVSHQPTNTNRMTIPTSPAARIALVQNWITEKMKSNPTMPYAAAYGLAEREPLLAPVFAAMIRAGSTGQESLSHFKKMVTPR